eukprot:3307843-Pyramimonas_sp.AAC.1
MSHLPFAYPLEDGASRAQEFRRCLEPWACFAKETVAFACPFEDSAPCVPLKGLGAPKCPDDSESA